MNLTPFIVELTRGVVTCAAKVPASLLYDSVLAHVGQSFEAALGSLLESLRLCEMKQAIHADAVDALQARLPDLAERVTLLVDLCGKCVDIYADVITTPITHFEGKPDSFPYTGEISVGTARRIVELMHRVPALVSETNRAEGGQG